MGIALDLAGAACLVTFAYLVFAPAALLVAGVLLLAASWKAAK
jgi:hypothetical protein